MASEQLYFWSPGVEYEKVMHQFSLHISLSLSSILHHQHTFTYTHNVCGERTERQANVVTTLACLWAHMLCNENTVHPSVQFLHSWNPTDNVQNNDMSSFNNVITV